MKTKLDIICEFVVTVFFGLLGFPAILLGPFVSEQTGQKIFDASVKGSFIILAILFFLFVGLAGEHMF